ncbi:LacI family transcriptional regulator [Carbonactinospora thermoautotrophica]|uniref:LacI family DNA-binding transcriptional regulator n=1 Tax=Carbonactinospora thermoautotrophica TaxID=1469144 RepID=UPI00099F3C21|nr:LacI family DNA-binding transcriptional regulator [Carbonactinospora thermoautotrophica]MCX9191934.1 LacI family transcriptional regulator [Carbonactinospora thermoautotrophica]
MATIHDVAARAGVSTATVSRALNGKASVDPTLVERVLAAVRELDYQPNALARSLRRQETAVWALVVSDVENPFCSALTRGVEDVAHANGYSVMLCNSDDDPSKEAHYLQVAVQDRVAGVILVPTSSDIDITRLAEHNIPVITIERPVRHHMADSVIVGMRQAAQQATEHLLRQGYERVACITGPEGLPVFEDRLAGYQDALHAGGRQVSSGYIRHVPLTVEGGRNAAEELLHLRNAPDALFVTQGTLAVGALETVQRLGLRTGRDLGFVVFDDLPWARLVDPPVTTVAPPTYAVGQQAAKLLLDRIANGPRASRSVMLPADLVVRGSSQRWLPLLEQDQSERASLGVSSERV